MHTRTHRVSFQVCSQHRKPTIEQLCSHLCRQLCGCTLTGTPQTSKFTACNSVKKLRMSILQELTVIFARPWNRKEERTPRNSETREMQFEIYVLYIQSC